MIDIVHILSSDGGVCEGSRSTRWVLCLIRVTGVEKHTVSPCVHLQVCVREIEFSKYPGEDIWCRSVKL